MEDAKTHWVQRACWSVAGVLLVVLWLASMALDDDRICSSAPLCLGYAAVLVLAVGGVLAGTRPARPSGVCLFGLAAGVYFLIRCVSGDMLSENCRELPLLLAAFVFYGAGYLMAQRQGGRAFMAALGLAVVVNVACFILLQEPGATPETTGRPTMSLAGQNEVGHTLFTYRNFSCIFLTIVGSVLLFRPLWTGWKGWGSLLSLVIGLVGVVYSFRCDARAGWGLLPLLPVLGWALWLIIRLYSAKKISVGVVVSGIILFTLIGVLLGEIAIGNSLVRNLLEVDTHGRTDLNSYMMNLLPQVPWYGWGAGATTWELVPTIDTLAFPNYAHNDYLQAWVDYGIVGFALMLLVVLWHLAAGFWSLASEDINRERRALVAACMVLLLSLAISAFMDFVWHNIALVGLTAFSCGVLASPVPSRRESLFSRRQWAKGHGPALRPVRLVGHPGAALCCVGFLSLATACACFCWRLFPAWQAQWEYNALCQAGATPLQRAVFLEGVMEYYPDPELAEHFSSLRAGHSSADNLARKERVLRKALESNPRQMFIVVQLAETLTRAGKCAEAEALMRDTYEPDGQPQTRLVNWPTYYGENLLAWGQQHMSQGNFGTALSMMEHALNIWGHADGFLHYRSLTRRQATNAYIAARRVDVDLMRALGVQKDDGWKQPLRPGGAPALYERLSEQPHSRKIANPYAKRSPFKVAEAPKK